MSQKIYILSSDNGYHWHTHVYFNSIEDAITYRVNECIEEFLYDWKEVEVDLIIRPLEHYQWCIEAHVSVIDVDGYAINHIIYIHEAELQNPISKHNIKHLNK